MNPHELWWSAVKDSLLIDRSSFMRKSSLWNARLVMVGDAPGAVVLTKDNEIHLVKLGKHRITRAHLAEHLKDGMTTRIYHNDTASRAFVLRLGFTLTGSDAEHDIFTFGKDAPCLQ